MHLPDDKRLYSFDLFDTLISRPLKRPGMVFDILGRLDVRYRFPFMGAFGFKLWRVLAERVARRLSRREDISIFKIYRILGLFVKSPADLLRKELAVEMALVQPIRENVDALMALVEQGKQCCVVSDMYLPPAVIRRMIRQNVGDIDFLVSSREGVTKSSGKMFQTLLSRYDLAAGEVLHVGDNPRSDHAVPLALGIEAVLVPALDRPGKAKGLYDAFCSRVEGRPFHEVGYALVGPCCVAFARFIADDAMRQGLERVIFAARDGYLIKAAFDALNTGIESVYVRLSRRALYVPSFAVHGDYERFFEGRISAADFFSRIGLSCPPALATLDPVRHKRKFMRHLEELDFVTMAAEEAAVVRAYLRAKGFSGRVGFVDLGWRASLQSALQDLCGDACSIQGYYFGSIVRADQHRAFYFENGRPYSRCATVFQALPVFEFLFTEPVHTLRRVHRNDDDSFDFDFVRDEPDAQLALRTDVAAGARRFMHDIAGLLTVLNGSGVGGQADLDPILARYLSNPPAAFIRSFAGVGHAEGFGGSKYGALLPDSKKTLIGYRNAYWRSAYVASGGGIKLLHRLLYSRLGMFLILNRAAAARLVKAGWRSGRARVDAERS